MKNTKKLSLKKIEIAKLDTIKGGQVNWPQNGNPTVQSMGCGPATQGLVCQYSQTPMSCQVCVGVDPFYVQS